MKDKYEISLWEDYLVSESAPGPQEEKYPSHYRERKIAVIGSDSITASCRALEPKLVENINGTHTFTFKMFYTCKNDSIDSLIQQFSLTDDSSLNNENNLNSILHKIKIKDGTYRNPFLNLLVNERKVKVKWKGKWYDFVIKNCQEDSSGKSITYTCKDLFINELSKTGFDIELDTELQNNQGTAVELATEVLKNTDWIVLDEDHGSDHIQQETEEPVYELDLRNILTNVLDENGATTNIASNFDQIPGKKILIFYSKVIKIIESESTSGFMPDFQFAYAEQYQTEANSQLVTNATRYFVPIYWIKDNEDEESHNIDFCLDSNLTGFATIFNYRTANVSNRYRAKRLIKSQKTIFDPLTDKLCKVYKATSDINYLGNVPGRSSNNPNPNNDWPVDDSIPSDIQQTTASIIADLWEDDPSASNIVDANDIIYGYEEIQYRDPTFVNNLLINSKDFTSTEGWINNAAEPLQFRLLPEFTAPSDPSDYTYNAKCYLRIPDIGCVYNAGLHQSSNFLQNGFTANEQYIFRYKAKPNNYSADNANWTNDNYYFGNSNYSELDKIPLYPVVCQYDENYNLVAGSGHYFHFENPPVYNDGWLEWTGTCQQSITLSDIYSQKVGFFIIPHYICWLEEVQFFPLCYGTKNNETVRINPSEMDVSTVAVTNYVYYNHTKYPNSLSNTEFNKLWNSTVDWNLVGDNGPIKPIYEAGFPKIRSITAKRSNCFNILQSIAETFQCWLEFIIEHNEETGEILYYDEGDSPIDPGDVGSIPDPSDQTAVSKVTFEKEEHKYGSPKKFVRIKKEIGQNVGIGFVYGIDLKTIQRTIESDQIVTKTIVIPNTNQFAKDGFCTIARSTENYPRTTFILNFDYYINQGLLSRAEVNRDLYLSSGGIGYYFHLHEWNLQYDAIAEQLAAKRKELLRQEGYLTVYQNGLTATITQIQDIQNELIYLAGATDWAGAQAYIEQNRDTEPVMTRLTKLAMLNSNKTSYESIVASLENAVALLNELIETQETEAKNLTDRINALHFTFYKKYSRFLQEGTWTSNDYVDDNLYYLDGESVAYTSSRPKISYNISVLRLSALDEYKSKVFHLGDISFIQDTEFFGYTNVSGIKTPYKEKVLISEVTSNFDEPEKDSFKVQNYKTQFEDLFHRITATTQTLQYASGEYARAADVVQSNGTIDGDVLQASIALNEQLVYSAQNEAIIQDSTGITVTDLTNPNKKTKITSGGVFITTDGGLTWKQAINGAGITTQYLTSGIINTNSINIMDGNFTSFRWDDKGISAYMPNYDNATHNLIGMDTGQYVRFDHNGIYGINHTTVSSRGDVISSDPSLIHDGPGAINGDVERPSGTAYIESISDFGLLWDRFYLKSSTGAGMVRISSDEDIEVLSTSASGSYLPRVKIGRIRDAVNSNNYRYGIQICDSTGSPALETGDDGKLWLRQALNISTTPNVHNTSNFVSIGYLETSDENHGSQVFNASNNFIVYEDGSFIANDGIFAGSFGNQNITISDQGMIIQMPNDDTIPFQIITENGDPLLTVDSSGLSLSGNIDALSGTIGGFVINNTYLSSINGDIQLNGGQGTIRAGSITIVNANVENAITLGNKTVLTRPYENNHTVFNISDNNKDLISIDENGLMKLGRISLDGDDSIIQGDNFTITPDISTFNNVNIIGKLSTVVFEANHVQAAGGAMIFKPSYKIENINGQVITIDGLLK